MLFILLSLILPGDIIMTKNGKNVKWGKLINTCFVRGRGGFGGQGTSKYLMSIDPTPTTRPDSQIVEAITDSQVLWYW